MFLSFLCKIKVHLITIETTLHVIQHNTTVYMYLILKLIKAAINVRQITTGSQDEYCSYVYTT